MPDSGSSQPPAPLLVLPQPLGHPNARATLPYRHSDWKGLALHLKTEFKGTAIAGLDFWPVLWLGGKSGFLPPQAVLAIV